MIRRLTVIVASMLLIVAGLDKIYAEISKANTELIQHLEERGKIDSQPY